MDELLKYARAQVMLQLHLVQFAAAQAGATGLRTELLLADAGFSTKDIAMMTGKSTTAVAKAVTRGRAARSKTSIGNADGNDGTNGGGSE